MYTFGYGMNDITPARPVMLHGYAARTRRSDGVSEPLRLGALAVSDGTTDVLIITIDMVGMHTKEAAELRKLIESETGVPAGNICISTSHTHFAPQISTGSFTAPDLGFFQPEKADTERVTLAAIRAAAQAMASMEEAVLERVRIPVPGVCFNRRTVRPDGSVETNFRYPTEGEYTFGPVDELCTALRFRTSAGTGTVLVNYGCHPVTGGYDAQGDHYKVSSDYIHYLRRTIEEAWGFPTLFTLGAAGDCVPRDRYALSRYRIGSTLGNSVILADRMFEPVEGPIRVRSFSLDAETILQLDRDEATAGYEPARTEALRNPGSEEKQRAFDEALRARFRSDLYPSNRFDIPVQIIGLGCVDLVAMPFEVLSEFSIRMKTRFPDSVLVSCANGYQGYLPFEYEYARGGYEASERSTHFKPGTADRLYESVIEMLQRN